MTPRTGSARAVGLPSRLTLLTAALVVLLPMLAVLQYRWAGQLSDAERERMQRNMRNAAAQFSDAFDHEIGRAFIALQVDGSIVRDGAWDRYAERYTAWFSTAAYPAVVAQVYLIDGERGRVRLRRRAWCSSMSASNPCTSGSSVTVASCRASRIASAARSTSPE